MITVTSVTNNGDPYFPTGTRVTFDDGTAITYDCKTYNLPYVGQTFEDFIHAVEYIEGGRA